MTDTTEKRYPKTLSAPVDQETWEWFTARADAADRTIGAELRRVILHHREQVEQIESFAGAVNRPITYATYRENPLLPGEVHVNDPVPLDDPEEGVA